MAKFKVCPECEKHNPPNMLDCINCGMDLSDVSVTDEVELAAKNATAEASGCTIKVRVCEECGHANPVNARKCQECGDDISYIVPTDGVCTEKEQVTHFVVSAIDDNYSYEIKDCSTLVGREHFMQDYLINKSYVSRKHAEFIVEDAKLFVKDCGATNHSFVNNSLIPANEKVELHSGDTISFGGKEFDGKRQALAAYFIVRME